MATIKYKGQELTAITEPQICNPPKKMLVWDSADNVLEKDVLCIVKTKNGDIRAITENYTIVGLCAYMHCAEIPEEPKPRRVTNLEFSRWLAQGNGQCKGSDGSADTAWNYKFDDVVLPDYAKARKWNDIEWHEPTAEYLGINEGK